MIDRLRIARPSYDIVSIGNAVDDPLAELAPILGDRPVDMAGQDTRSRMRCTSNKLGAMLLTTGKDRTLR